jgi:hypothetical protein
MAKEKIDICVDFDGTCTTHDYPRIGLEIGAVPVLKRLVKEGHNIIIFTMRDGKQLDESVKWYTDNGITVYGVNRNPRQTWTKSPKAYGQLYIDDAALGVPLKMDESLSDRPFVDWTIVEQMLENAGLLTEKSKN